jgi:uncharacterized protein YxeA
MFLMLLVLLVFVFFCIVFDVFSTNQYDQNTFHIHIYVVPKKKNTLAEKMQHWFVAFQKKELEGVIVGS